MGDTDDAPDEGAAPETGAQQSPDEFKSEESKQRVLADLKREREARAALQAQLQEIEDRDKSEGEKLTERLTAAEQRALEAEQRAMRAEVAAAKGLTPTQAKRLVGSTVEELEADADEILDAFKPQETERPPGRPAENLRPGSVPDAEPSVDIRKIVDSIERGL